MIQPVSVLLYGESPDFNAFSFPRIFFSLTEIIPVAGLAAAVKLLGDRRQEQQKIRTLQAEKRKAELHFLRAQTNPHFLFNTLNNLYGIARKEAGNTAPYLLKLSRIMRYILKECNSPTIPLSTEFRVLEDYVSLEQLRFDDSLRVSIQTEVDHWESPIAPLILLPFVENAFKHGAGESRNAPEVLIHLQLVAGRLVFIVANSTEIPGTDYAPGTGLSNVNRQLDLIYGDRYQLDVSARPEKFTVQLTIQLPHG